MITNELTVARQLLALRRKEVLALGLMLAYALVITQPAHAQEVSYILFDPTGSTYTQPNCINREGAITGYYNDSNGVTHGFLRARDGTITTFDAPGSAYTIPQSVNRVGAIVGTTLTRSTS